ncbi:hypothetical protein D1O30_12480 [Methylocystis hirsuta]|uniref:Uncharacterized protein n=1 Tax=Methylocystis hirsuta TaxID=369798 RepID=A0A3M9XPX4_9HYPH|nr:hypothetical protein D1O30_12480 [Methylocystis hirsuta]
MSFASETSKATGKDKRSIERAAARGAALGDDLNAIAGTSLDKGVELDALAKVSEDARADLIELARSGEIVSARRQASSAAPPSSDAPCRASFAARDRRRARIFFSAIRDGGADVGDFL